MALYDDIADATIDATERLKHLNRIDALLEKERLRLAAEEFVATVEGSDGGEVSVTVTGTGDIKEVKIAVRILNTEAGKLVQQAAMQAQLDARAAAEKRFQLVAKKVIDADPVKLLAGEK